jgi:hypothetical protein
MVIDPLKSGKGGDSAWGWFVDANSRAVVIALLAPNQKTGNVGYLLAESLPR